MIETVSSAGGELSEQENKKQYQETRNNEMYSVGIIAFLIFVVVWCRNQYQIKLISKH
jgi:hypothetical protein